MPHKKLVNSHAKILETIQYYEELLKNSNVQAYLLTIRKGEGTLGPNGFKRLFGGGIFEDSSRHPNIYNKEFRTTAAGGFQITYETWQDVVKNLELQNFGLHNQTFGAAFLIERDSAVNDILNGDITSAIRKTNGTWTSLPESKHKPPWTMQEALEFYQEQGGRLDEANMNYIPILNWKNRSVHPVDFDKQYLLLPEYIKMLMGKPNDPFINKKRPNGASKNKPSTTDMFDPIPGNITTGQPGVDRVVVTEPGSTRNNSLDGFYDLVISANNRYDNSYSYLPDVKKESIGRMHPLMENAPLPYPNDRTGQNEFLNNQFPYFLPNVETGLIALPNKQNLIDTATDRAKESDAILKFNKKYDVPGIHGNPVPKLELKKDMDTIHTGSKKQAAPHHASSPYNGWRPTTTINLNKSLIENFTINAKDIKEGINDFKHKVEEVLLEILNSANVIQ